MIRTVIRCSNNIVLVLDSRGRQIPAYQGQYESVKEGILRDAPPDTAFAHWLNYDTEPETVSREGW